MKTAMPDSAQSQRLSDNARLGIYETILNRRDVRSQFLPDPIPDDVLARVLTAAHHAPSVGFMQPWDFILISGRDAKAGVKALFDRANAEAAAMFEGEKADLYRRLKLEGILDAPINICVTCDRNRVGPVALGRTHHSEMDIYSAVCAVQNLWLAARAEGLGLGWVSILDHEALRQLLGIPEGIVPIAYLCLGWVSQFHERPELEKAGWRSRLPIESLVHLDHWSHPLDQTTALSDVLREMDQAANRRDAKALFSRSHLLNQSQGD